MNQVRPYHITPKQIESSKAKIKLDTLNTSGKNYTQSNDKPSINGGNGISDVTTKVELTTLSPQKPVI